MSTKKKPKLTGADAARIRDAFAAADQELKRDWRLTGAKHDPRATVNSVVGKAIAGLSVTRDTITKHRHDKPIYPTAVVLRAAELLGVRKEDIIGGSIYEPIKRTGNDK